MNNGYIKLYRKTLDNPIVNKDNDYFKVWIYLLLNATHKNMKVLFGNTAIELKPGQLVTGRERLAKECNISESKIERIIKTLKNEQQIKQQTNSKGRLITILNWEEYQENEQQIEQQVNNNRTISEQQVNTNNNVKNVNNVRNNIKEKINKKEKYGEFENVLLTDEEYHKLEESNLLTYIDTLSNYIASKGKRYKSHYATILNWSRRDGVSSNVQLADRLIQDIQIQEASDEDIKKLEERMRRVKNEN